MGTESLIPVIDLFAGPGGLAEGFWRTGVNRGARLRVTLSIEKDVHAHQTLLLRAFVRQFGERELPREYYDYLQASPAAADHRRWILFEKHPREAMLAQSEARHLALGPKTHKQADELVSHAIHRKTRSDLPWILVGGPPCQAYSLVGRSRMRPALGAAFYRDERHTLYEEYLRIIRRHRPAVFVMENVKGLLSSTLGSTLVVERILSDLQNPGPGMSYEIAAFDPSDESSTLSHADFIVRAEKFGIPQSRHRVIIVGFDRSWLARPRPRQDLLAGNRTILDAIGDLPRLRSGLSASKDSAKEWLAVIREAAAAKWFGELRDPKIRRAISAVSRAVQAPHQHRGGRFVRAEVGLKNGLSEWLIDRRLDGVCNHESRSHMASDLHRYLFASCFADAEGRSPRLEDFPPSLRPSHGNLKRALRDGLFSDRFRVQEKSRPATTITSHISKDGHYFIHPDPKQCRSLTVREAARLQTFPDNYFFEGPRTEQYRQVGNAVPPLLAHQIANWVVRQLNGG